MSNSYFESEQAVIGGPFKNRRLITRRSAKNTKHVKPSSFQDSRNRAVFEAITDLEKDSSGLDIFILDGRNSPRKCIPELTGGLPYMIEIQQKILSAANIMAYADNC